MPRLGPPRLTRSEQKAILGTGHRLTEIVGLNVGDVYPPDPSPARMVRQPAGPEPCVIIRFHAQDAGFAARD